MAERRLRTLCKSGGPRPIARMLGVLRCSNIPYKLRASNTLRLARGHARSLLQRIPKLYGAGVLSLAVLRTLACFSQADFLAFDFARIAGDEAGDSQWAA